MQQITKDTSKIREVIVFLQSFLNKLSIFPFIKRKIIERTIADILYILLKEINEIVKDTIFEYSELENFIQNKEEDHVNHYKIKKFIKNKDILFILEVIKQWKCELFDMDYQYIDNLIEKELKRRHIPIDAHELEASLSLL